MKKKDKSEKKSSSVEKEVKKKKKKDKEKARDRQKEKRKEKPKENPKDKPKDSSKEKAGKKEGSFLKPTASGARAASEVHAAPAASASLAASQTISSAEALEVFRALGDPNRLEILRILHEEEELCAGDLLEKVAVVQSTLSHHMKTLTESGLVAERKQGRWTYYRIVPEMFDQTGGFLHRYVLPPEQE